MTTHTIAHAAGADKDYGAPDWCALCLGPKDTSWFFMDNKGVIHRERDILVDLLFVKA